MRESDDRGGAWSWMPEDAMTHPVKAREGRLDGRYGYVNHTDITDRRARDPAQLVLPEEKER